MLPIFQAAIDGETDSWTAGRSLDGLAMVLGPDAEYEALQKLLARNDDFFVARLSLSADKPQHVPLLLQLLNVRREIQIRSHVAEMAEAQLREDVIYALRDLGDARGIPFVEPCLNDNTPIGRQDDRGAMLHLSDAARDAVAVRKQNAAANVKRRRGAVECGSPRPPPADAFRRHLRERK